MVVCRKADVDPNKRAGEMTDEEVSFEPEARCNPVSETVFFVSLMLPLLVCWLMLGSVLLDYL